MALDVYSKYALDDWEALGEWIRDAEARASGPAGDGIGRELANYPAWQLTEWKRVLEQHQRDIKAVAEHRDSNVREVLHQINRALGG